MYKNSITMLLFTGLLLNTCSSSFSLGGWVFTACSELLAAARSENAHQISKKHAFGFVANMLPFFFYLGQYYAGRQPGNNKIVIGAAVYTGLNLLLCHDAALPKKTKDQEKSKDIQHA